MPGFRVETTRTQKPAEVRRYTKFLEKARRCMGCKIGISIVREWQGPEESQSTPEKRRGAEPLLRAGFSGNSDKPNLSVPKFPDT